MTRPLTIAVRLTGGMGDVLLASPFLEQMHEILESCEITAYYHSPKVAEFVLAGARFVHAIRDVADLNRAALQRADVLVHTGHFPRYVPQNRRALALLGGSAFRFLVERNQAAIAEIEGFVTHHPRLDGVWARMLQGNGHAMNYLDGIGQLSGFPIDRHTRPFLTLDPGHRGPVSIALERRPYITVHDGFDNRQAPAAGRASKCWPLEHWQALVALLRAAHPDYFIVQLGAGKSRPIAGVDACLIDKTTLAETAWILKDAALHVDTDSGLAHLAYALHTPAVVLFGPTPARYFGHDPNTNVAVGPCSDCWWSTPDWLAKCPRGLATPACMQAITPALIEAKARDVLAQRARQTPKFRAGVLRCYDGMNDEARAIADVIAITSGLEPGPITGHLVDGATGVYVHASKQWEYAYAVRSIVEYAGIRKAPDGLEIAQCAGLKIADVGGGRGALAAFLAAAGATVEQFDRDYQWGRNGHTEPAYQRWSRSKGYRARFGSIYNLPAASESFDVVLCISVLEHLPDKRAALRELVRLLRPGGICVLTFDLALEPERFRDALRVDVADPDRLAEWLAAIGIEYELLPNALPAIVELSQSRIQFDGVAGIPDGMTVAGLTITRVR